MENEMTDLEKLRAGIGPVTDRLRIGDVMILMDRDAQAAESLMRQAADEIEELRRKLRDGPQTLNAKWLDNRCWDGCQSLVFERQIEEPRKALANAAGWLERHPDPRATLAGKRIEKLL